MECKRSAADDFREWADRFLNFEKTPEKNIFWLDTMNFLCERLGHPEKKCRSFHVAGSKGKGSISIMIAKILEEAGFKTGVYSSPHISDFRERVATSRGFFDDDIYSRASENVIRTVQDSLDDLPAKRPVTWFELVTLFAMECFKTAGCDWSVYEVGLGGRLDSTNVILPECSCISTIELEHTEFLGDTLEKIAFEKGGIIKTGVPVVVAPQSADSVKDVFRKIALEKKSELIFADEAVKVSELVYKNRISPVYKTKLDDKDSSSGMEICLESDYFSRPIRTKLRMPGDFQAWNAALASLAVKKVYPELDEKIIEVGLSKASLPGRFEVIESPKEFPGLPFVVLDGAHTERSVKFTLSTFSKLFGDKIPAHLLFACAADKDAVHIARCFSGRFSRITLTKPGNTKASNLPGLADAFESAGEKFTMNENYTEAIEEAFSSAAREGVPLLITGSFYLLAEVKDLLSRKNVV
ncbi:MAG: folylpolyglutamate synthase/dihydrofolate synthase family protein [Treponema sp.]|nr:folylpolyglutamate synthase/dihydrofolate synthase family protein [Treponema sp.]